jgi:hypothetical protein
MNYLDDVTKKWLDEVFPITWGENSLFKDEATAKAHMEGQRQKAAVYFQAGFHAGSQRLEKFEKKTQVVEETFDLIIHHPVKPGFNVALYCVEVAKQGLVRLKKVE